MNAEEKAIHYAKTEFISEGKVPKYIFALIYENQAIFRVLEWDQVILTNDCKRHYIRLADIFKEATPLETY
jgi:hypothetical protein